MKGKNFSVDMRKTKKRSVINSVSGCSKRKNAGSFRACSARYSAVSFQVLVCLASVVQLCVSDKFTLSSVGDSVMLAVNTSLVPFRGSFLYTPPLHTGTNASSVMTLLSLRSSNGTTWAQCKTYGNDTSTMHGNDSTKEAEKKFSWSLDTKEGLTCWFSGNNSQTFNVSHKIPTADSLIVRIGGFVGCLSELKVQNQSISCKNNTSETTAFEKIGILAVIQPSDIPCGCNLSDFVADATTETEFNVSSNATKASENETVVLVQERQVIPTTTIESTTVQESASGLNETLTVSNSTLESTNDSREIFANENETENATSGVVRLGDSAVSTQSQSTTSSVAITSFAASTQMSTTVEITSTAMSTTPSTTPGPTCVPACANGGTCGYGNNCTCPPFTTGGNCGYWNVCEKWPNPCMHGGGCKNIQGSGSVDTTPTPNGTFVCKCASGYKGPLCQHVTGGLSGGAIAGIVICIIALIALAIAGVFVFRFVRRSRKLKGKYNPAKEEMTAGNGPPMPMQALSRDERLI